MPKELSEQGFLDDQDIRCEVCNQSCFLVRHDRKNQALCAEHDYTIEDANARKLLRELELAIIFAYRHVPDITKVQ